MKLLLDTHVLLWWLAEPSKIAHAARTEIGNPRNAVFVSAVSIQEIVIKEGKKRLTVSAPLLPSLDENGFFHLPVNLNHAMAMRELPPIHKDPFDRQLVAQCRAEAMTLVTHDQVLANYDIALLPA